jgi:hypothetical protein
MILIGDPQRLPAFLGARVTRCVFDGSELVGTIVTYGREHEPHYELRLKRGVIPFRTLSAAKRRAYRIKGGRA